MSNQRRPRRPFLSIGLLMRRFSRALTQRYVGEGENFAPVEDDAQDWDDSGESFDSPATPRAVARPVASTVDDAIRAAERSTPSSRPTARPAAPKPAPPRPVAPKPMSAPPPASQPVAQRAADSTPATPPAPLSPAQSAAPAPSAPSQIEWPEGVPPTWNGSPIPISNTPTPPALKVWIQRERDREIRRKEILAERKDQLLSQLPPQPEDPNAPRNTRLRPRGHAGVDYINTDSLRGGEEAPKVQRNFDLTAGDSGTPSLSTPRESSPPPSQRPVNDDDETSTPAPLISGDDYGSALDIAIQRAESLTNTPPTDFDAEPVRPPAPRSLPQTTDEQSTSPSSALFGGSASLQTAPSGENQRTPDVASSAPSTSSSSTPPVIQRADSPAPIATESLNPTAITYDDGSAEDGFDAWDSDDAPDVPDAVSSTSFEAKSAIQRQNVEPDFYAEEDSPLSDELPAPSDSAPPMEHSRSALDAAIQRAELVNRAAPTEFGSEAPAPRTPSKRTAQPTSSPKIDPPALTIRPIPTITPVQRSADDFAPDAADVPDTPPYQAAATGDISSPQINTGGVVPFVTPQAAMDAAIQRAESVTPPAPSDAPTPRKPSKRSAAPESSSDAPIQRTADGGASQPAPINDNPSIASPISRADNATPLQRQSAIDAAIQRAESPTSDDFSPRFTPKSMNDEGSPAPESRLSDVTAPDAPTQASPADNATPIQRQSAIDAAIQRAESPTSDDFTPQFVNDDAAAIQPVESGGFSAPDAPPIAQQSAIDAAIQRAESPNFTPTEQPRFDRQPDEMGRPTAEIDWEAPESAASDEAYAPDVGQFAADTGYSEAPSALTTSDAPIQRASADRPAPSSFEAQSSQPAQESDYDSAPTVPTSQSALDSAIQRAETVDVRPSPFDSAPNTPNTPISTTQSFVPPTRTSDRTAQLSRADAKPQPSAPPDPAQTAAGEVSLQRSAVDTAIQRAESVTPSTPPQPFAPRTRKATSDSQPSVELGGAPSARQTAQSSSDFAPHQPVSDFSSETPTSQPALDAAIQRAESVDFAPQTASDWADKPSPSQQRPSADFGAVESARVQPMSSVGVPGQPNITPSSTPVNVGSSPAQRAAIDGAIQRAESTTPSSNAKPFVPTTRKATGAGSSSAALPPGAIQRDADEFGESWALPEGYEQAQSGSERPDVFQAMMMAGMVSPTSPSAAPIQRRPDDGAAKQAAISRAETPTQRPDLFQALQAAARVSDANAAQMVQRAANSQSMAQAPIEVNMPLNSPLQRALMEETESPETHQFNEPNVDVDKLADDVYRMLRDKLRIEAERRPK